MLPPAGACCPLAGAALLQSAWGPPTRLSTMDEVTFKSDTVLSDVHLYTPNQRHLMVRLNSMGQPGKASPGVCVWGGWRPVDPGVFSQTHSGGKGWEDWTDG